MGGDWRQSTWGQEVSLEYGKALRGHASSFGSYRVFGSNGPIGWTDTPLVNGPGIILGRKGAYRGVEFSPAPFFVIDTAYYVVPKSELNLRWLYYAIQFHKLGEIDDGSPIPSTTRAAVYMRDLAIPPLTEQRRMAHILGALDDKIALNQRLNETLEAMARALFKSWFVDFDPIHAKAEGRAPSGMNADTAKLFPNEFVQSELGYVPKGWRASTLGKEVERCGGMIQTGPFGSQLHASDYVIEGVPVVMPKDIVGRRVSSETIARVREADADRLKRHRLLFGDIVYSRRGDVERHALISGREAGWLCGTGCLLVRLGRDWPSPAFASFALDSSETRAWISQHAIGATMPNLNTGILEQVPLLMAPDSILGAFAGLVAPIQSLVDRGNNESSVLGDAREVLLPRLLSGKLSVASAEHALEAIA